MRVRLQEARGRLPAGGAVIELQSGRSLRTHDSAASALGHLDSGKHTLR